MFPSPAIFLELLKMDVDTESHCSILFSLSKHPGKLPHLSAPFLVFLTCDPTLPTASLFSNLHPSWAQGPPGRAAVDGSAVGWTVRKSFARVDEGSGAWRAHPGKGCSRGGRGRVQDPSLPVGRVCLWIQAELVHGMQFKKPLLALAFC